MNMEILGLYLAFVVGLIVGGVRAIKKHKAAKQEAQREAQQLRKRKYALEDELDRLQDQLRLLRELEQKQKRSFGDAEGQKSEQALEKAVRTQMDIRETNQRIYVLESLLEDFE